MNLYIKSISSPIGNIIAASTDQGICLLEFEDQESVKKDISMLEKQFECVSIERTNSHLLKLEEELADYFKGDLKVFSIPIHVIGTDFQKQVWNELSKIPYGETISYQQQALNIDKHKAVRAVANTNGKNKISIIIPCHRVIGKNGTLTGYASGLDRKRFLLNLEKGK